MSPANRRKAKPRPARQRAGARTRVPKQTFPRAFAALLRSRKIPLPKGLLDAPPDAYARQPANFVEQLSERPDAELRTYAERIAGYAARQAARAREEWESSPLIAELRRRKLRVPAPPTRAAGLSVSLATPLQDWTDKELLDAVREWSKRAGN